MDRRNISLRLCMAGALCLFVAGCKESLHRGMTEAEANEIYAALDLQGISVERKYNAADGNYDIRVELDQISEAVVILRARNLPREKFNSMGDVFGGGGLVSTPFEERARYIYATNQELSESLSLIDGVSRARVHIVMPEPNRITQETEPARATVFIYYQDRLDVSRSIPLIKTAVASGVDRLYYENVTVAAFPETARTPRLAAGLADGH